MSELHVHKPRMSFPNGSSAVLDDISQIFKNLTAKSNGRTGLKFLKALTNLIVILEGKVPGDIRQIYCAKLGWKYNLPNLPFGRQYGVGHMGDKSVDQMGWSN